MKKALVLLLFGFFLTTPLFAAITEETVIDKIEILRDGQIQVREATIIYRDGVEIAQVYHREVLEPDSKVSEIKDDKVKSVAQVIWTPEVKAKYKEEKEKRNQ